MQAIITLIHGTWARGAAWTHPESALCQSLRETAAHKDVQVEFRSHTWSGSNSFKSREEAARTLAERLRQDFEQSPGALHFLIGHSHGGNIAIDAVRAHGIGDSVSGIVTMSTPFVSCQRSRVGIAAGVLALIVSYTLATWLLYYLFEMLSWAWAQASAYIDTLSLSGWIRWPVYILLSFWLVRFLPNWRDVIELVFAVSRMVIGGIRFLQERVLERFDRHLEQPIPIFCVRFRLDEALIALNVSRFAVKPVRILTVAAALVAAIGLVPYLILPIWTVTAVLVGFVTKLWDWVFSSNMFGYFESLVDVVAIVMAYASLLLVPGFYLTILFSLMWLILGYVMVAMTLGGWGNIFDQLLADFRITATPEGANATSKVYSPFRWRRTLLHSLTYGDRNAIAEISHWIASRMDKDTKIGSPEAA